jgi:hypothetical protein
MEYEGPILGAKPIEAPKPIAVPVKPTEAPIKPTEAPKYTAAPVKPTPKPTTE